MALLLLYFKAYFSCDDDAEFLLPIFSAESRCDFSQHNSFGIRVSLILRCQHYEFEVIPLM